MAQIIQIILTSYSELIDIFIEPYVIVKRVEIRETEELYLFQLDFKLFISHKTER